MSGEDSLRQRGRARAGSICERPKPVRDLHSFLRQGVYSRNVLWYKRCDRDAEVRATRGDSCGREVTRVARTKRGKKTAPKKEKPSKK